MSKDANNQRHKKVITIDDEAPIRHLIRHSLRSENFDIFEAGNGREGLEVIRLQMPDVVVLDVVMPEMNGFETLKAIRADEALAHIPVLLLTGSKDLDIIKKLTEHPHTDYLAKPFLIKVLKERVHRLIASQPAAAPA